MERHRLNSEGISSLVFPAPAVAGVAAGALVPPVGPPKSVVTQLLVRARVDEKVAMICSPADANPVPAAAAVFDSGAFIGPGAAVRRACDCE